MNLSPAEIITEVCATFGVSLDEIRSDDRSRKVAWPRQAAMALIHRHCGGNLSEVGRIFHRDHTTAQHAVRAVDARRDTPFGAVVAGIEERLREEPVFKSRRADQ